MPTENDARAERLKGLLAKLMDGLADGVVEEYGVDLAPQDLMISDPALLRIAISGARVMKAGMAGGSPDPDGSREVIVALIEHVIFLERQLDRMPDA